MEQIYLSTVTPVYKGGPYLRELVFALEAVQKDLRVRQLPVELIESIFVDDDSVDESAEVLREMQQTRPWMRVVQLSRNSGQHGATVAGILHSSGDWVATLDEDLQHRPEHLLALLSHAAIGGYDVVYATPEGGVHRSRLRNVSSVLYKSVVSWLSSNPVVRKFSSFRMMRGSVVRAACSVSTHDTYFDVVLSWFSGRIGSYRVPMIDIRTRGGGKSGFNTKTLLLHARRMLISSQIKPLRIAAAIGMLTLVASVLLAAYTLVLKIYRPEMIQVRGWVSLILTISFFGGLTSFLIGVVLEYMSTVIQHILGKPTFFVVDRSKDALLVSALETSASP